MRGKVTVVLQGESVHDRLELALWSCTTPMPMPMPMPNHSTDPIPQQALRRSTARELSAAAAAIAVLAGLLASVWDGGASYGIKALLVFALGAALIWRGLPEHPHPHFGAANRVTLARWGLVALFAALVGEGVPHPPLGAAPTAAWWLVVAATATALLDAVDGALARRAGMASAFGARFDMETDAAFTLVLCALVIQAGQTGVWVLASGLMRYGFVAAARIWPWLGAPLGPSKRRQTICVIQIATLIACLAPVVPPWLASALATLGLAVLTMSFAIDTKALALQHSNSLSG